MTEFFVISCVLLMVAGVITKGATTRKIEVNQRELYALQAEEKRTDYELRQAEAISETLQARKRQLQHDRRQLGNQLEEIQAKILEMEGEAGEALEEQGDPEESHNHNA